jgi:hypothetical protein
LPLPTAPEQDSPYQWQLVDERLIGETRLSFITVRPATINAEAGA